MADEPFIDTHIHFFDHSVPGLEWAWLRPGFTYRHWQAVEGVDAGAWSVPEFLEESAGTGVSAAVHGHSADPIDDPVVETAWLDSLADEHGWPQAIVGRCHLAADDAPQLLARHAAHERLRGVRDPSGLQRLEIDEIARGMDAAAELGLSVEVRRDHTQFGVIEEMSDRWPDVVIALSHACLPLERTPANRRAWQDAMTRLGSRPNIVCKISAVAGASDPDWTVRSIRPWILGCVEALGAQRCMLGSNWPVDRLFGTYRGLVDAYREVVAELTASERASIMHATAERVYLR